MDPRGLVDLRGVAGELVPEAVEIDALASRDEPLGIRAAEGEMPEQGMAHEVVPGGDAGNRRIHHHQFSVCVGIAGGIGIGDHGAEIVPDDGRPIEAQVGEDGPDVGRLRALVIALGGMRGETHAAQVGHHHGMVSRKLAAKGAHMSPVSPKPWSSTTAGP